MRVVVEDNEAVWQIAVATNRNLNGSGVNLPPVPSNLSLAKQAQLAKNQTGSTTFGFCSVHVPTSRPRGLCEVGRRSADIRVDSFSSTTETTFVRSLRESLKATDNPNVLVFVHGFNVSFEDSLARTAQLANDMPFGGLIVGFSWASSGDVGSVLVNHRYAHDEQIAERYFWSLGQLLVQLRKELPKTARIHLLAHSMGNRVALRALNALAGRLSPTGAEVFMNHRELAKTHPNWSRWSEDKIDNPVLSEVVFAAPDVASSEFKRFVQNAAHIAERMTLYTSDIDVALEGSLKYHQQGYRAGDSRAHIQIPGLRVVHTSRVSRLDPLGHSYYGSDPQVLDNLAILFQVDEEQVRTMTLADFGSSFSSRN
ncbi:MAG: alpha/beta hydrolase [Planctomycetaceae bacterium]